MKSEPIAKLIVFAGIAYLYIKTIHRVIEKVTNNTVAFILLFIALMYVSKELVNMDVSNEKKE